MATMFLTFASLLFGGVELSVVLVPTPVGALLLAPALIFGLLAIRRRSRPQQRWLLLLFPLLTAGVAASIGTAFVHYGNGADAVPPGPVRALEALGGVHLAGAIVITTLARDFRPLAVSALCAGTLVFAGCWSMADMAAYRAPSQASIIGKSSVGAFSASA